MHKDGEDVPWLVEQPTTRQAFMFAQSKSIRHASDVVCQTAQTGTSGCLLTGALGSIGEVRREQITDDVLGLFGGGRHLWMLIEIGAKKSLQLRAVAGHGLAEADQRR